MRLRGTEHKKREVDRGFAAGASHTRRSFGKPSPKSPRFRRCCWLSCDSPSYSLSLGGPRLSIAIALVAAHTQGGATTTTSGRRRQRCEAAKTGQLLRRSHPQTAHAHATRLADGEGGRSSGGGHEPRASDPLRRSAAHGPMAIASCQGAHTSSGPRKARGITNDS